MLRPRGYDCEEGASATGTFNHMARRIVHQLVDDIDGDVLDIGSGEAVTFSVDGVTYEIDLSEKNAEEFRDKLAPYISAGRRVSTGAPAGRRARGSRRRATAGGRDLAAIRTWAKENGHRVSDRGRVPDAVLQAYDAAH